MAELRARAQPPDVMGRRNSEHWAGPLYLRRLSIYLTRALLPTGISANGVTWLMVPVGVAGAAVLAWPSWWATLISALLIQFQILLDCSDGEVARVRETRSPRGVYIDRLVHYSTEMLLPIGVGVHVDGGFGSLGGWTTLGTLTGAVVVLNKSYGDLIHVARAYAGLPLLPESGDLAAVRVGLLRRIRSMLKAAPFFRAFVAIEFTLLVLVAASVDAIAGGHHVLQWFVRVMLPLAVLVGLGRLTAILLSNRLTHE